MNPNAIKCAEALREAARARMPVPPLRDSLAPDDIEAAYEVQELNTEFAVAVGRRVIGRKIGLTAKVVQQQLGVDQPDYGMLFADMLVGDGEPIGRDRVIQPRVEGEIALVLERDLAIADPSVADVISAVAYCLPAIEVVDSRIRDWAITLADTIADNASSGLFVLGETPVSLDRLDLRLVGMVMERGNETVSTGVGAACLGSPLYAARWLARTMHRVGRPLKAGDVVMTGALGSMVPVAPGDAFAVDIGGMGRVRAVFQ